MVKEARANQSQNDDAFKLEPSIKTAKPAEVKKINNDIKNIKAAAKTTVKAVAKNTKAPQSRN